MAAERRGADEEYGQTVTPELAAESRLGIESTEGGREGAGGETTVAV